MWEGLGPLCCTKEDICCWGCSQIVKALAITQANGAAAAAEDEVADLRTRLAKAKRQALAFKARATEAAAARDAALAELAALQQRPQVRI